MKSSGGDISHIHRLWLLDTKLGEDRCPLSTASFLTHALLLLLHRPVPLPVRLWHNRLHYFLLSIHSLIRQSRVVRLNLARQINARTSHWDASILVLLLRHWPQTRGFPFQNWRKRVNLIIVFILQGLDIDYLIRCQVWCLWSPWTFFFHLVATVGRGGRGNCSLIPVRRIAWLATQFGLVPLDLSDELPTSLLCFIAGWT